MPTWAAGWTSSHGDVSSRQPCALSARPLSRVPRARSLSTQQCRSLPSEHEEFHSSRWIAGPRRRDCLRRPPANSSRVQPAPLVSRAKYRKVCENLLYEDQDDGRVILADDPADVHGIAVADWLDTRSTGADLTRRSRGGDLIAHVRDASGGSPVSRCGTQGRRNR